ncbi:MAG TPA: ABC transporter ATP-binding protein [Candidatus Dormibacteraeota bacterium]|nr:ABC transporter ATP-binding protein [Candidatus Dormibacteraeota bacterium]
MNAGSGWLGRLAGALRPHARLVWIGFAGAIAAQLTAVLTPLIQRHVVDTVIVPRQGTIAPWIALLLTAGALRFGLGLLFRYCAGRASLEVQYDLRTAIFAHLQRLDFARHDELQTGQLVSRSISDLNLVQQLLGFLPNMIANGVFFVGALAIMLVLSPVLALVALAAAPLMLLVSLRLRRLVHPATWDSQQRAGVVAGVVDEAVTGVRIVKGFGQERRELGRLAGAAESLYGSRVRAIRLRARYQSTLQALPALAQVGILALGGWLAIHHQITLGTFLVSASYVTQLQAPTRLLANLFVVAQQGRASVERLFEVLDSTPAVQERPDAPELEVTRGEVELSGVTFGYLRSEPVLRDFTLTVRPGETVALVGTAGSGKSTVALLLPRFYDVQGGAIRIDGVDVRDVTLDSLRAHIGVVFEDSFLFSASVRANIAYGRPDATLDEVVAAARAAEADEFIRALPDGYDTVVGEQGLTLSGGQRQRVALARALMTDPRILLLDDATSSIDTRIEEEIHATLRRLLVGRTTILVARRRSTLRLADRICLVEDGRVADAGTHDELLARSLSYRLLLAGPETIDGDAPADGAAAAAGQVDGVTPALWQRDGEVDDVAAMEAAGRLHKPAAGGGGGPGGNWALSLEPTEELRARIAALPPVTDRADVSVADAAADDGRSFSFWRFLRPWRWQLGLGLLLVVLDSVATVAGPSLIRVGIDEGVLRGVEWVVFAAAAAFLVVTVADWADTVAMTFLTGRTGERVLYALRVRIFAHLQRLSLSYYDRELGGRIMTRMTSDVEALTQLLQTGLVTALASVVTCVSIAIALLLLEPRLGLATLTVVVPLLIGTALFRRYSGRAYRESRERVAVVNADFQEGVAGVRVAQAFVREGRNDDRFAQLSRGYLRARLRAQTALATYFPFVAFLSDLGTAIVLSVGAVLVFDGSLSEGVLIAFLLYLGLFFSPIQQLSQVLDSYQQAAVALSRIRELLVVPTDTPEAREAIEPSDRLRGDVELRGVRFAYPGVAEEALRGVDLRVEPGETMAFVGETGAGKSTILKLVARYYDVTGGALLVDGIDVRRYDLGGYRAHLGVVPQEPFLFAGTIRDNIAYGRPGAGDAAVEAAARAVGAHEVIERLPGGYLHVVGERGRTLSIGQRQLLALARALLVDPDVLLLDEATSNLDLATEARVALAMGIAARGRTTLLIAHRLPTAARADRVAVIDRGRLVELGTHAQLLRAGGTYAALWDAYEHGEATGSPAPTLPPPRRGRVEEGGTSGEAAV